MECPNRHCGVVDVAVGNNNDAWTVYRPAVATVDEAKYELGT